jgi:hypothetical protein
MEASPWFCRGPAAGCESHRRSIFCGTFRGRDFAFRLRGTRDATPWRYQARCPFAADSCEFAAMGVRTFLPSARLTICGPAIIRLTRQDNYTASRGGSRIGEAKARSTRDEVAKVPRPVKALVVATLAGSIFPDWNYFEAGADFGESSTSSIVRM